MHHAPCSQLDMDDAEDQIQLPPGFRFHPSDEELIVYYLRKKAANDPLPAPISADVQLYKFNPWDLPMKASVGDEEWYFFTPRERKYPNGVRPNRMAPSGYWKATGTDKPISSSCGGSKVIGLKKTLAFYVGRPPKGKRTHWIMHEYRLAQSTVDEWVLCRVRQKTDAPRRCLEDRKGLNSVGKARLLEKKCPLGLGLGLGSGAAAVAAQMAEILKEYPSLQEYPFSVDFQKCPPCPNADYPFSLDFQKYYPPCMDAAAAAASTIGFESNKISTETNTKTAAEVSNVSSQGIKGTTTSSFCQDNFNIDYDLQNTPLDCGSNDTTTTTGAAASCCSRQADISISDWNVEQLLMYRDVYSWDLL